MFVTDGGLIYRIQSKSIVVLGFEHKQQNEIFYLNIPDTVRGLPVTEIGSCAFLNENLCSVSIPKSVRKIKEGAFARCSNLKHVLFNSYESCHNLPILVIENAAFQYCNQLETVNLWEHPSNLGKYSFRGCAKLMSLNIKINSVASETFKGCLSLKSLFLADDIFLAEECLLGCGVHNLIFDGDANIDDTNKNCIKKQNIKIICRANSNLEQLAYDGYNIECIFN